LALPRESRATGISGSASATTTAPTHLGYRIDLACKALGPIGCDVRDETCQKRLFYLAQCVSARSGVRPPVRFISEEASRQKRLSHRARASNARAGLEQAVHVLGLGRAPGTGDRPAPEGGVGANAYYAPQERVVFFVGDDALPYDSEIAVLILVHEYVHAIQDRKGELLRAQSGRDTRSFDQDLTVWSAFEGEATLYEEVVRAFLHDLDPQTWVLERLAARTAASDDAILRQGRPLESSLATFPYSYGAYWAALEATQPVSTQQLLAKRHGWPSADAQRCADESPENLAPEQPRRAEDTLGAWLVQTYVRKQSRDAERARSAARRWRGDWLSLYSRLPDEAWSFVWQTCWDSSETANEMRELISAQLRASPGHLVSVTNDAHRVTATVRARPSAGR
jgi:hypothetical protein